MDADGNLLTNVDLGYPTLGLPYPQSGLAYTFPGNLLDYEFTATGSTGANRVIATSQAARRAAATAAPAHPRSPAPPSTPSTSATGIPLSEIAVSATGRHIHQQRPARRLRHRLLAERDRDAAGATAGPRQRAATRTRHHPARLVRLSRGHQRLAPRQTGRVTRVHRHRPRHQLDRIPADRAASRILQTSSSSAMTFEGGGAP